MLLGLLLIGVVTWAAYLASGGRGEFVIPVLGAVIFLNLIVALVLTLWPWLPLWARKLFSAMGALLALVVGIAIIIMIIAIRS
jgi:hypothetical protein